VSVCLFRVVYVAATTNAGLCYGENLRLRAWLGLLRVDCKYRKTQPAASVRFDPAYCEEFSRHLLCDCFAFSARFLFDYPLYELLIMPHPTVSVCLSVCLFVPWRSCLGYRHAGCRQLSHRRPPQICGLRTRPRTDVDPPRFLPPSNWHRRGHIVSPPGAIPCLLTYCCLQVCRKRIEDACPKPTPALLRMRDRFDAPRDFRRKLFTIDGLPVDEASDVQRQVSKRVGWHERKCWRVLVAPEQLCLFIHLFA